VSFKPGSVSLAFAARAGGAAVPVGDLDADIEDHLGRRSTVMLLPYVSPFNPERVSLRAASADPSVLLRYDVLIWNHYCLDSLPRELTPEAIEAIREHVARGGGLFLVANAIRLLPQLTEIGMDNLRTLHIGHLLDTACQAFGLEAILDGHPIFRGMQPTTSGARTFPLIAPGRFDVFKRVLWEAPATAPVGGNILAKMYVEFKKGQSLADPIFEPSSVLWEWPTGKGTIVACGCGLRYTLGSPNRWVPSENSLSLVRNVVRHLARGASDIRVGVL
jgi:hypothetical protein